MMFLYYIKSRFNFIYCRRPVEIIIGFWVLATSLIKLKSVISKEDILYKFGLCFFKKMKRPNTKWRTKKFYIMFFFAILNASLCHLNGV